MLRFYYISYWLSRWICGSSTTFLIGWVGGFVAPLRLCVDLDFSFPASSFPTLFTVFSTTPELHLQFHLWINTWNMLFFLDAARLCAHTLNIFYCEQDFISHSKIWLFRIFFCPTGIYLLKVNNRNTRTSSSSSVSIVNFEHVIADWVVVLLSYFHRNSASNYYRPVPHNTVLNGKEFISIFSHLITNRFWYVMDTKNKYRILLCNFIWLYTLWSRIWEVLNLRINLKSFSVAFSK